MQHVGKIMTATEVKDSLVEGDAGAHVGAGGKLGKTKEKQEGEVQLSGAGYSLWGGP